MGDEREDEQRWFSRMARRWRRGKTPAAGHLFWLLFEKKMKGRRKEEVLGREEIKLSFSQRAADASFVDSLRSAACTDSFWLSWAHTGRGSSRPFVVLAHNGRG
jgi:hypothetical protein